MQKEGRGERRRGTGGREGEGQEGGRGTGGRRGEWRGSREGGIERKEETSLASQDTFMYMYTYFTHHFHLNVITCCSLPLWCVSTMGENSSTPYVHPHTFLHVKYVHRVCACILKLDKFNTAEYLDLSLIPTVMLCSSAESIWQSLLR